MYPLRRLPILATLGGLVLLLAGCGPLDELDPYADGIEVEAVGAIDLPSTVGGDFVPGLLRISVGFVLPIAQAQAVAEGLVPGAQVAPVAGEPRQFHVAVPFGVTLEDAAEALAGETSFTAVELVRPPDQDSVGPMLVETRAGALVDESSRLVWLATDQVEQLLPHAFGKVVRVRGTLMQPATEVSPAALLRVEAVQELAFLPVTREGTFRKVGNTCRLLVTDTGEALSLHGDVADEIDHAASNGDRLSVTFLDAGLSVVSCSGGRQVVPRAFTRR